MRCTARACLPLALWWSCSAAAPEAHKARTEAEGYCGVHLQRARGGTPGVQSMMSPGAQGRCGADYYPRRALGNSSAKMPETGKHSYEGYTQL